jgi:hypothetical protein
VGWVPTYSRGYGTGDGLPHAYPLPLVEKLYLGLLSFLDRSQLGMHGIGSMASAFHFGFSPKMQHCHAQDRYIYRYRSFPKIFPQKNSRAETEEDAPENSSDEDDPTPEERFAQKTERMKSDLETYRARIQRIENQMKIFPETSLKCKKYQELKE